MKTRIQSAFNIVPGLLAALVIAAAARFLEGLLPSHVVGGSVLALFIGMGVSHFWKPGVLMPGLKFTSKKLLKFAIILLGASLSISTVLTVGKLSLTVMCFTLLTCFGGGYLVGKLLHLNWRLSSLISAGTGICGGSAIAALAPVIEAEDKDIAFAMSATFLFDMGMIVLFPIIGRWMGLSDMAYGLWAGTAVNDTSSVVAAGFAYGEAAGNFATMVKLTRTLSIIPVVLVFSVINVRQKNRDALAEGVEDAREKLHLGAVCPWFILGFLALAVVNSLGVIPAAVSAGAKGLSKFLMVSALAAVGMNTDLGEMKKSGPAAMLHGFIVSALVVVVALAVEFAMGLV